MTYEVFSFGLHNNYSKYINGIDHVHIYRYTNVKEKRKKIYVYCVAMTIILTIFISLYNDQSFRYSNKLVNFFKNSFAIF